MFLADPFGYLIWVRAFQTEVPRMEETIKGVKIIAEWREKVGAHEFFQRRLPRDDEFHKYWPENVYGEDKYGHFVLGIR